MGITKDRWQRILLGVLLPLCLLMPASSRAQSLGDQIASAAAAAVGSSSSAACQAVSTGDQANLSAIGSFVNVILSPINSAQSAISSKANSMASSATPIALALAGVLALSYFLWGIVDSFAGSGDSFMGITVGSLVPAVIVAACLGSYAALVGTNGGLQGLLGSFTQAATGSSSASGAIASYMQQLAKTLASSILAYYGQLGCVPFYKWSLVLIGELVLGALILFAVTVLSVIAVGELVGVMLTGIVMVGLGVAVGPLFVACAVCKWSNGFFTGWLKFLLGASAYQMVISVVLTLVSSMLSTAQSQMNATNPAVGGTSAGVSFAGLLGLLGITWVITHLFKDIPRIASSLFGGGAVGHASFNRAAHAMAAAVAGMGAANDDKVRDAIRNAGKGESDEKGGSGSSGAGSGGSGGPSVNSESGSFSATPALTSSEELGGFERESPSQDSGAGGGHWQEIGGGWEADLGSQAK
ncbi:hypothetical protein P3T23_009057 [Paraburkholderia sp. GAS448]|uniref:type IV secretion system protein n=1 Tax=Paraburkholderia sp. GAS448 TaxID=3035136 RepID=UPI003D1E8BF9